MAERYATLAELKDRLKITDTVDDGQLMAVLEGASRAIDEITGRRFYASTETRYYQTDKAHRCYVDDLLSVTTLATDHDGDRTYERTWAATDYDLMPANASTDLWPYSWIEITPAGDESFPVTSDSRAIKITGSFGFCTTANRPDAIYQATLLLASQVHARKDATYGVVGSSGFYQRIKHQAMEDPLTMMLLSPYMRMT